LHLILQAQKIYRGYISAEKVVTAAQLIAKL